MIRVAADGRSSAQASLVTTVVADRPVGFNLTEEAPALMPRKDARQGRVSR